MDHPKLLRKLLEVLLITLTLSLGVSSVCGQAQAVPYELGTAQIIDPSLNNLKIDVTLQGVLALPDTDAPAPLVVVLHGRHGMCGVNITIYPCEPGTEIRYDVGFTYLLEALASEGYAALAININAGLTEAYGRGDSDARTAQIVDLHLEALRDAVIGVRGAFPLSLENRINFDQMAFIGHSSGGGAALGVTRARTARSEAEDIDALLLIAAAYNALGPEGVERSGDELYAYYRVPSDLPVATILPDCDGDQIHFWSQIGYEAARLDPERTAIAASVRLFSANHNHFNTNVERGDRRFGYPPCFGETTYIMPRDEQEGFLTQYAIDFLETSWGSTPASPAFDATSPAPNKLYNLPVETSLSVPSAQRLVIATIDSVNAFGGTVQRTGDAGLMVCPSSESCLAGITAAGRFGYLRLSWGRRGVFEFSLPETQRDLTSFTALHVRAVPDYTSVLNSTGTQLNFAITLKDSSGSISMVVINDESFLQIPAPAEYYGYEPFILYPASVRVPLIAFSDIDLAQISSVSVQAYESSGTLLLADLEFLKAE